MYTYWSVFVPFLIPISRISRACRQKSVEASFTKLFKEKKVINTQMLYFSLEARKPRPGVTNNVKEGSIHCW